MAEIVNPSPDPSAPERAALETWQISSLGVRASADRRPYSRRILLPDNRIGAWKRDHQWAGKFRNHSDRMYKWRLRVGAFVKVLWVVSTKINMFLLILNIVISDWSFKWIPFRSSISTELYCSIYGDIAYYIAIHMSIGESEQSHHKSVYLG